jgi:hypothetical protein
MANYDPIANYKCLEDGDAATLSQSTMHDALTYKSILCILESKPAIDIPGIRDNTRRWPPRSALHTLRGGKENENLAACDLFVTEAED